VYVIFYCFYVVLLCAYSINNNNKNASYRKHPPVQSILWLSFWQRKLEISYKRILFSGKVEATVVYSTLGKATNLGT